MMLMSKKFSYDILLVTIANKKYDHVISEKYMFLTWSVSKVLKNVISILLKTKKTTLLAFRLFTIMNKTF